VKCLFITSTVFSAARPGPLTFHVAPPPSDADVAHVLATVCTRVGRLLARRQLEPEDDSAPADPLTETSPVLAALVSASVQGRVALGSRLHLVGVASDGRGKLADTSAPRWWCCLIDDALPAQGHSQGRQACRSSYRAANEVRAGDQHEDGESTRSHDPALAAGAGGRDYPVTECHCALLTTALVGALPR
jgi:hypothetical protein